MALRNKTRLRGRSGVYRDRNGNQFHYDSRWELWRMQTLDMAGIQFAREGVRIPYYYDGRRHTYLPDLVVTYWQDGERKIRVEEIKPSSLNNEPQNIAKWQAAAAFCKSVGYDFVIINEKDLTSVVGLC